MGMLGNIGIGLIPWVGQVSDIRDFSYAVSHMNEHSFWGNVGLISLSLVAFIPLVGDATKNLKYLKYADEVGDVVKHVDKVDNVVKGVAKNGDKIIDGIGGIGKHSDDILDAAGKGAFKSQELFNNHFIKHADDFGNLTKKEYLKGAQDLINSSPGGNILTITRANGDELFYNKATNEFAVKASNGTIRTYFKPTDGIGYFNRQQ